MKNIIIIILIVVISTLVYGFYIKSNSDPNGEIIIGIAVLSIAFILMPLFIYHRYKNKNMSNFRLDKWLDELNKNEKK
ncbi:hypothetical protein [Lutibacter sp.]|uniref:hypothetical protein n=1 Tax=Lutibacter sp. TaxID=1925666 RepID=UPI0027350FC6|nr:hypothetical protein [Lutibacter sp.]MDP3313810.1 hypothetical protein [Lutibacter sp.]